MTTNIDNYKHNFKLLCYGLTTEGLIDKLEYQLVRIKDQQHQRKYLIRAISVITDWSRVERNCQHHEFIFDLSDISIKDERIAAELVELDNTTRSMLIRVLHVVVKRLFAMVSARWFYESVEKDIEVVLQP